MKHRTSFAWYCIELDLSPSLPASLSLANAVQQNCPVKYANSRRLSIGDTGSVCCAERGRGRAEHRCPVIVHSTRDPFVWSLEDNTGCVVGSAGQQALCSSSNDLMIKVAIQRGSKRKWEWSWDMLWNNEMRLHRTEWYMLLTWNANFLQDTNWERN